MECGVPNANTIQEIRPLPHQQQEQHLFNDHIMTADIDHNSHLIYNSADSIQQQQITTNGYATIQNLHCPSNIQFHTTYTVPIDIGPSITTIPTIKTITTKTNQLITQHGGHINSSEIYFTFFLLIT